MRPQFVPGELLVKFKPETSKFRTDSLMRLASVRFSRGYRTMPGLKRVSLSPEISVQAARAMLEASPEVEYAEPNYYVYPHVFPNDQWFPVQFNLHMPGNELAPPDTDIDAPEAWDITTGSPDIVVAVLDTGIFPTHEDLAGNLFRNEVDCDADGVDDDANGYVDDCNGIDAYQNDSDPTDITVHGSHVAGIIGAVGNNAVGVTGVAWNVRILPCRFIDFFNGGDLADAIQCFDYVAAMKDRGVNIVATNNSWAGIYGSHALDEAIGGQLARGILTIASAGNDNLDNDREPVYPCNTDHSNVICVGSSNFFHQRSGFSNYGATSVHLSAPGEQVYSSTSANSTLNLYDYLTGTSMSAPAVTGGAVLLKSQDPSRNWRAIKNLLITGTDALEHSPRHTITDGRLNLIGSMQCSNRTVVRRLLPHFLNHVVAPGIVIKLRSLHINCAQPNGNILVDVAPSGESIVLVDNGVGDDEVAGDGLYSGSWTAPVAGDHQLRFQDPIGDVVNVHVDPDLKPGFPVTGKESGWFVGFWDSPAHEIMVGNLDADPEQEIVMGSVSAGPLFAWNHDGSLMPGWPLNDFGAQPYAALGEFDGNAAWSEVANHRAFSGIRLYTGDGQQLPGWPQGGLMLFPPASADLDADGLDEVIAYPAHRADGSVFNPVTQVPVFGPTTGGPSLPTSIAVGDLDFDGLPEMVVVRDIGVWASSANDVLEGFPATYPPGSQVGSPQNFPVIGDVDGDGSPEIVVTTTSVGGDIVGRVHVFSNRGVHERIMIVDPAEYTTLAPVLADLDGDGVPEILVQTAQTIHAWKGDGTMLAGWPVFLGADAYSAQSTPVVGDINGDGLPDVMTTARNTSAPFSGRIYLYHRDGRPHDGYPQALLSYRMGMASAIADIDLDGRNELLVAPTSVPGTSATLYAFDYNNGNPSGPIEWGEWMEGPHNRGFYELGKNLPNHAFLSVQSHGHGNVTADGGSISCGADCVERVAKGSRVTLRANALPGAVFDEWLGACAGQGNPCNLLVNGPTTTSASFRSPLAVTLIGSGTGTVTSAPAGLSCTTNCTELFDARTVVTLTATPDAGDGFDGWSGACTNVTGTCRVYMDAAKSVTALFVGERRLTVDRQGSGAGTVTSAPAGINCGATCAADFLPNAVIQLTPAASPNSQFRRWTGNACDSFTVPCVVSMDRSKTVGAVFDLKPVISVSSTGAGRVTSSPAGINCGTACSAAFPFDDLVTLTATPDFGSTFGGWGGDCAATGTHTTCVLFSLDGPRNVSAQFSGLPVLGITRSGSGNGQVTSSPSGINCAPTCSAPFAIGTVVQLTASPAAGSTFMGWSESCTGTQRTCTVTMNSSNGVMAQFDAPNPPPGGGGGGGGGAGGGGGGGALGWLSLAALGALVFLRRRVAMLEAKP